MAEKFNKTLNKLYKPAEVLRIFHIPQRRLSNLVDKRVTIPEIPAQGAGHSSLFGYINLLEIGLAETLFKMGLSLHLVREMIEKIRGGGYLKEWAEDFEKYFSSLSKKIKKAFYSGPEIYWDEENIKKLIKGKKPLGNLVYFVHETEDPVIIISPYNLKWSIETPSTLHPDGDREGISDITGAIIVDLGKIWKRIDEGIAQLN